MRKGRFTLGVSLVIATGATIALSVPAIAGTEALPAGLRFGTGGSTAIDPEVRVAMERDLSLTSDQVNTRIRTEQRAASTESTLRSRLRSEFGGAWMEDGRRLVVAVTSQDAARRVREAGAEAKLVSTSEAQLNVLKDRLDQSAGMTDDSVQRWYVDPTSSSVVVNVQPGSEAKVRKLVETGSSSADLTSGRVRIVAATGQPKLLAKAVRGGDGYYIAWMSRCSVGFPVKGGFVSAGHCGTPGLPIMMSILSLGQGKFKGSSFPGNDYSYVTVNSSLSPSGAVNNYKNGTIRVKGSKAAAVGASICRSGSTTGVHCGKVKAKNQTVNYGSGQTVKGLTETNVCAEPGDSGGPYISGNQAQGVTSGGDGDCKKGGTTFFQPVNEILSAYKLTLLTS